MDPQACYERWKAARDADLEEATEAWRDLARWLRGGGFEPAWTEAEAHAFRCWVPRMTG